MRGLRKGLRGVLTLSLVAGFAGVAVAGDWWQSRGSCSKNLRGGTTVRYYAAAHPAATQKPQQRQQRDIVDTAVNAGSFKTLIAAVKAAGLVETLKSHGPFTVFAPTDDAFAKLPEGTVDSLLKPENKDRLIQILTYHVVPKKVMATEVVKIDSANTVAGPSIAIKTKGDAVMVDNAQVIKTDIACSNGVIHVIDAVLIPRDIVDIAASNDSFTTLVAAVKAAGLVETLKSDGPFTVFAPTNKAFAKLPEGTVDSLLKPENKEKLQSILTYHVVPGKVLAKDVVRMNSAETVNGETLAVKREGESIMVENATVIQTDIIGTNGIIHVIDEAMLPNE